jgi:hypothetical protein
MERPAEFRHLRARFIEAIKGEVLEITRNELRVLNNELRFVNNIKTCMSGKIFGHKFVINGD